MLLQLAVEVLDELHRAAPTSHGGALLGCAVVLVPLCALVAGRLGRGRSAAVLGGLAGAAVAVATTLTLFRGVRFPTSVAQLRTCAVTDPALLSGDGLANLVLFAPAALLAVLAVGRPLQVVLAVSLVSVGVEALQAMWSVGVCDSSDALLNVLGAALAACAASCVPGSGPCRRSC